MVTIAVIVEVIAKYIYSTRSAKDLTQKQSNTKVVKNTNFHGTVTTVLLLLLLHTITWHITLKPVNPKVVSRLSYKIPLHASVNEELDTQSASKIVLTE